MQEQVLPKPAQEKKDIEEMEQPLQDQAPSPLKDPQELFEDQPQQSNNLKVYERLSRKDCKRG